MTTPEGWYADPADSTSLRWWDGSNWTESTQPAATTVQPAVGMPAAGQATGYPGGQETAGWQGGQQAQQPGAWPGGQPGGQQAQQPGAWPGGQPQSDPWPGGQQAQQPGAWPGGQQAQQPGAWPAGPQAQQPYGYAGAPAYQPYPGAPGAGYAPYQGGKAVTTPDGVPLAGLGNRFGAMLIDGLLLGVVCAIVGWPILGPYLDRVKTFSNLVAIGAADPADMNSATGYWSFVFQYGLLTAVVAGTYQVVMLHTKGATVGKMATGVRVRPWGQEGLPTWQQAGLRALTGQGAVAIPIAGGLYLLLDYLWATWDPRKQALHDKAPGTIVVRSR